MINELRDARNEVDRAQLHRFLDELLDLRERSDPKNGTDPAGVVFRDVTIGKDSAAAWAITLGNLLLLSSAGWAFTHIIGRALPGAEAHPIDAHQHEAAGMVECSIATGVIRDASKALVDRTVVGALADKLIFPFGLAANLKAALRALDFGEVWPIVEAQNLGLHGKAYTLSQYKLIAIEYASFLFGQGYTKQVATQRVADIFGVSPNTLRSWQRRDLPTFFRQDTIFNVITNAKAAGQLFTKKRDDPDYANADKGRTEAIPGTLYGIWQKFEGTSINDYASDYNKTLRDAKS
jgi:hypothetical protein